MRRQQSYFNPVQGNTVRFCLPIMISDKSFEILIKFLTLGNKCTILPFKWDSEKNKIVLTPTLKRKLFPFVISVYVIFAVYYSGKTYTVVSDPDLIIVVLIFISMTFPICILIWIHWNQSSVVILSNAIFDFNRFQLKYVYVSQDSVKA